MTREDRILVVEDDATIARTLESRFACDHATDGWDAIEKLETNDYAAIVIDADVKRHSGFGVLNYLREEVGAELANVILLTRASERDSVQRRVGTELVVADKSDAVAEIEKVVG
jgi:DNA-binding response OmpR family regulator